MNTIRTALLAAALGTSLSAFAQAPGYPLWYIGAGVGQGHLNTSGTDLTGLNNAQVDDKDNTYTIRTGIRMSPFWGFELGYYDLGRYGFHGTVNGTTVSIDGRA